MQSSNASKIQIYECIKNWRKKLNYSDPYKLLEGLWIRRLVLSEFELGGLYTV